MLLTIAPNMPTVPGCTSVTVGGQRHNVEGAARLLPEINVKQLSENEGQGLIQLCEKVYQQCAAHLQLKADNNAQFFACDADEYDHYLVQRLRSRGHLALHYSPNQFVFLVGKYEGSMFSFTAGASPQQRAAARESLGGAIMDANEFEGFYSRQMAILNTVIMLADNYMADVRGSRFPGKMMSQVLGCACCGALPQADSPFQYCPKCRVVVYCSQHCQREHWQEHKQLCTHAPGPVPSEPPSPAADSLVVCGQATPTEATPLQRTRAAATSATYSARQPGMARRAAARSAPRARPARPALAFLSDPHMIVMYAFLGVLLVVLLGQM